MTIEAFLISSSAVFGVCFFFWWIEARLSHIKKLIEIRVDEIRERLHAEDRTYYELRKSINTRIGVLEEKLGWLDDQIEEAKIEEERIDLERKIAILNSDVQFYKTTKKPTKKKAR